MFLTLYAAYSPQISFITVDSYSFNHSSFLDSSPSFQLCCRFFHNFLPISHASPLLGFSFHRINLMVPTHFHRTFLIDSSYFFPLLHCSLSFPRSYKSNMNTSSCPHGLTLSNILFSRCLIHSSFWLIAGTSIQV